MHRSRLPSSPLNIAIMFRRCISNIFRNGDENLRSIEREQIKHKCFFPENCKLRFPHENRKVPTLPSFQYRLRSANNSCPELRERSQFCRHNRNPMSFPTFTVYPIPLQRLLLTLPRLLLATSIVLADQDPTLCVVKISPQLS